MPIHTYDKGPGVGRIRHIYTFHPSTESQSRCQDGNYYSSLSKWCKNSGQPRNGTHLSDLGEFCCGDRDLYSPQLQKRNTQSRDELEQLEADGFANPGWAPNPTAPPQSPSSDTLKVSEAQTEKRIWSLSGSFGPWSAAPCVSAGGTAPHRGQGAVYKFGRGRSSGLSPSSVLSGQALANMESYTQHKAASLCEGTAS
ncbi:unnamed protein product [Pleuronectes platessa]|uniref:Uncharacterized protein n=1 Tax=Pleuronectes platessa TaxID=8262 RepID=A0A9N7UF22_PLEPL|nr:unnamed protein product [Pleuronectes platessa]